MLTHLFFEPEAKCRPFGEKAIRLSSAPCGFIVSNETPRSTSHNFTDSADTEAKIRLAFGFGVPGPVQDHAIEETLLKWSLRSIRQVSWSMLQIFTVLSSEALARRLPRGSHWMALTWNFMILSKNGSTRMHVLTTREMSIFCSKQLLHKGFPGDKRAPQGSFSEGCLVLFVCFG